MCLKIALIGVLVIAVAPISHVNCMSPEVLCVTDVAFTILADIFNSQVDIGIRLYCPPGHHCVSNSDTPCQANYVPPPTTTSTTTSTTTTGKPNLPNQSTEPPTSVGGPINCDGSGYHQAEKCNEYYECAPLYWWFKAILRTCKEGYFYSENNKPCSMPPNVVCTIVE